jgi:hypothetical protein
MKLRIMGELSKEDSFESIFIDLFCSSVTFIRSSISEDEENMCYGFD